MEDLDDQDISVSNQKETTSFSEDGYSGASGLLSPAPNIGLTSTSEGETEETETSEDAGNLTPDVLKYDNLPVSNEIKELFKFTAMYKPHAIELGFKLKPFNPEYLPAVGDVDSFLKVPLPEKGTQTLGLTILDEPSIEQSDPTALDLKLRTVTKAAEVRSMNVKNVEDAILNPKAINNWIANIEKLHKNKQPTSVLYSKSMPDTDLLMQEWPAEIEELISNLGLPSANLDCTLQEYIDIACSILDIPVYQNRVESLHVLFSLYTAFKELQLFQAADDAEHISNVEGSDVNFLSALERSPSTINMIENSESAATSGLKSFAEKNKLENKQPEAADKPTRKFSDDADFASALESNIPAKNTMAISINKPEESSQRRKSSNKDAAAKNKKVSNFLETTLLNDDGEILSDKSDTSDFIAPETLFRRASGVGSAPLKRGSVLEGKLPDQNFSSIPDSGKDEQDFTTLTLDAQTFQDDQIEVTSVFGESLNDEDANKQTSSDAPVNHRSSRPSATEPAFDKTVSQEKSESGNEVLEEHEAPAELNEAPVMESSDEHRRSSEKNKVTDRRSSKRLETRGSKEGSSSKLPDETPASDENKSSTDRRKSSNSSAGQGPSIEMLQDTENVSAGPDDQHTSVNQPSDFDTDNQAAIPEGSVSTGDDVIASQSNKALRNLFEAENNFGIAQPIDTSPTEQVDVDNNVNVLSDELSPAKQVDVDDSVKVIDDNQAEDKKMAEETEASGNQKTPVDDVDN